MNEENHQHVVNLSFSKKQHVGKSMDSRPAVLKKIKELILTGVGWFLTFMKNFQFWLLI
jgi:hypothetical protein